MEVLAGCKAMADRARQWRADGLRVALVPTMGFLHEGHCALMRLARKHADRVVASIFVNPIQFAPGEDLASYPRDLDRDRRLLEREGVDALFHPSPEAMYPSDFQTRIRVGAVSRMLCGASRPGHFDGVCTVVAKLFGIVTPHCAVFGEKDWQQLAVIRRMVLDLNMPVTVIGHPIIRESDGLAMSSRNTYLRPEDRPPALCLSRTIALARKRVAAGDRNPAKLYKELRAFIEEHQGAVIDYLALVDKDSLEQVETIDQQTLLALAVNINGRVRLIDNGFLLQGMDAEPPVLS